MPLIAWAVLAYASTLIIALSVTGPTRVVVGVCALLSAALFVASKRTQSSSSAAPPNAADIRRATAALVCAIVGAATLVAQSAVASNDHCRATLAARTEWSADLEQEATESAMVHGMLSASGCTVRATMLVSRGSAPAGSRVTVVGHATLDERGLFLESATLRDARAGPLLLRLRAAAGHRMDRVFGSDAAMARALVIADMSAIPADVRDRYARAGLVHMLSVSGLHVGIIALALELLASILRLPSTPARVATLVLLAAYVAAIGAPPPAVRAAVMLGALLVARLLQRPTSPWAILALGAAAPLSDPMVALDLGWQLSVAGTASLIAGGALSARVVPSKWSGWRRTIARGMTVSIVATAVTAPLVAWAFGTVAMLGPITNLLADPVMGLLQPVLFLAIALPSAAVEHLSADAAHALLFAFDAIARIAASVPHAVLVAMPSTLAACSAAVASIALIVACLARRPQRAITAGLGALAIIVVEPLLPTRGVPELHMIDVGQGDAFALRTGRGRWIVIDAGRSWLGGDAGKSVVAPYLARRGGDVALFVLSHPHADHVGGAASLFKLRTPGRFLDPGYVGTSPPYRAALVEAARERMPWQRVRPGDSLVVDDVVLSMLAPDSTWAAQLADANLASSVLVARMNGHRVLFTGDAEVPEEQWLLAHFPDALRADVLKVGHHGSSTSTSPAFLGAVHPRLALVSVGAHNSYGHPDAEIMQELRDSSVTTLRTDLLGTVVLRFRRNAIAVQARGTTWLVHDLVGER